jgi:hypothetical protein
MSAAPMPVCLSGAAPGPAADDVAVARMTVRGTRVWMAYRPDQHEWRRRQACGLGPVLAWDLLDTLMDFPAGLAVPVAGLGGPVRRRLAGAPAGVVRFGAGRVTRTVVPALMPLLAVLTARDWRAGLAAASRFANYCPRLVVVPGMEGASEEAVAAARGRGAGLAAGHPGRESVLLEPAPVPDWEPTPAWWRFCEEIYGQVTSATARD